MAQPFPLQSSFVGMVRDNARELLPGGVLWNCVDYIPEILGSPLRKRGGWLFASNPLGLSTYVDGVAYGPFATGEKTVAIGQDGNLYQVGPGLATSLGAVFPVAQNPVFHRIGSPTAGAVIIPAASRTTAPKSYDGTTLANLGGTPPQGKYAAVWNDRTLLGNGTLAGTLYPNRLWFGPIGNSAATWDTANGWIDGSLELTGIGVLKTAILLFHRRHTERVRGSTPPTATAIGDLALDDAFAVGCIDARSIVRYNDTLIWADVRGVYQSDGSTLRDLTTVGGMRSYWRSLLASYTANYTIAAGVFNDIYIVSVMNGTTMVDCLALDITRGDWFRFSNFGARCFIQVGSTYEEMYMGLGNIGQVASISSILAPTYMNKLDGDGTPVQPLIETALFRGFLHIHRKWLPSFALQQWNDLYFDYDLTDAATDYPTIVCGLSADAASVSYETFQRPLAATLGAARVRRPIGKQASALMFRLQQVGPSADTRLSGIEAVYAPLEAGKLEQ